MNKRVLVFPDPHYPYNHPDIVAFLKAIKERHKPTTVVCLGDEVDGQAIKFHPIDPDLPSAGFELRTAQERLKPLFRLFPRVHVLESNHGSLVHRKAMSVGLSRDVLKPYREMLGAPRGWTWHDHLILKLSDGSHCFFVHGQTAVAGKLSKNMAMHAVQGHYHTKFQVIYWANRQRVFWDVHLGCLIDDTSLAYAYNKTVVERPLLGALMIENAHPRLIPMVTKNNRWIGALP